MQFVHIVHEGPTAGTPGSSFSVLHRTLVSRICFRSCPVLCLPLSPSPLCFISFDITAASDWMVSWVLPAAVWTPGAFYLSRFGRQTCRKSCLVHTELRNTFPSVYSVPHSCVLELSVWWWGCSVGWGFAACYRRSILRTQRRWLSPPH